MTVEKKNNKVASGEKMTLPDIQDALYDMLVELDKFCRENKIRYYLTGGSMLGAIRHHGFIPWDDDIDINMPRPDYEKFCELTKNGMGKYRVEVSSEVYVMFAKVFNENILMESTYEGLFGKKQTLYIPIFIDICPMDGLPDNNLLFKLHASYIGFLTGLRGSLFHGFFGSSLCKKIFRAVTYPIAYICGAERLGRWIERSAKKYKFENSKYIGAIVTFNRMKDRLPRTEFEKIVEVDFRTGKFYTTAIYDKHLRILYGDNYMEIPPEERRETRHFINAWRLK